MDIKSDIKKRRINYPTPCVLYFKLLFVFIVDYHKPFEQKLIVNDYVTLAVRNYYLCHTACGNHSAFFTKLVFYPLYNAVNACGIAMDYTALHTVDSISAYDLFRRYKADERKL